MTPCPPTRGRTGSGNGGEDVNTGKEVAGEERHCRSETPSSRTHPDRGVEGHGLESPNTQVGRLEVDPGF